MTNEDIYNLLYGRQIVCTGRIVSIKSWYIKNDDGQSERIGYKLAVKTPYKVRKDEQLIPIFVSVFGRERCWFYYRWVKRREERVGIRGTRDATKLYHNPGYGEGKRYWVILKRKPTPKLMYLGKQVYLK